MMKMAEINLTEWAMGSNNILPGKEGPPKTNPKGSPEDAYVFNFILFLQL